MSESETVPPREPVQEYLKFNGSGCDGRLHPKEDCLVCRVRERRLIVGPRKSVGRKTVFGDHRLLPRVVKAVLIPLLCFGVIAGIAAFIEYNDDYYGLGCFSFIPLIVGVVSAYIGLFTKELLVVDPEKRIVVSTRRFLFFENVTVILPLDGAVCLRLDPFKFRA